MLNTRASSAMGLFMGGFAALLVAVFTGLITAWEPDLAIFLLVALAMLAVLVGAFSWSRHVAMRNGQLALFLFLFWLWIVNLPAIVAFDPSGLTQPDLFNPQSIGRIALFFLIGLGFVFNYFRTSRREMAILPRVWPLFTLPLLIYGWYLVDALLVLRDKSLLLALYRIAEWGLLVFLIAAVVARAPINPASPTERENWFLRVVFTVLLFSLLITLLLLPIAPHRVYFVGQSGVGRLGNPFAHPNTLGVLAGMAFFYFLERKPHFFRLGLLLSFGIMVATYSRGAWGGFTLATTLYLLLRPRTMPGRFFVAAAMILTVALAWFTQDMFINTVQRILARGNSVTNLATASERTVVWQASQVLIKDAPVLGHGFVAGPKKLNDVMAGGKTAAYFRAPHAHNEFVQTQVNGGIPATLLLAILLARTLYLLKALSGKVSPHFFRCMTAWIIMLWSFGMLTPSISGQLLILGALLIYLYIVLELLHSERRIVTLPIARKSSQGNAGHWSNR